MEKVDKITAQKAAAFLWRYKMALYRSMEELDLPNHRWLAEEIERGASVFGDVVVDAGAWPPIKQDRKHPDFFRAVVMLDDTAEPGLVDLGGWRAFVYCNGPIPKWRQPKPRFSLTPGRTRLAAVAAAD